MNDFTINFDYDKLSQNENNFLEIKKMDYCGK